MSSLVRRATAAAVVVSAFVAGAVMAGSPASAGTNCDLGFHCVFFTDFNSASHRFFNSDNDFTTNTFNIPGNAGNNAHINNNIESASNSSTSNLESHYYQNINATISSPTLFCVNPGEDATRAEVFAANVQNQASGLILRNRTSVRCL